MDVTDINIFSLWNAIYYLKRRHCHFFVFFGTIKTFETKTLLLPRYKERQGLLDDYKFNAKPENCDKVCDQYLLPGLVVNL